MSAPVDFDMTMSQAIFDLEASGIDTDPMEGLRDAVAELVEACRARDAAGDAHRSAMRAKLIARQAGLPEPDISDASRAHLAAEDRYMAALARFGGAK
jgi:hypothetical protein